MLMHCVLPELRTPVDLSRFAGTWYELARTEGIPFEPPGITDVRAKYTWDGTTFGITNTAVTADGAPMAWSTRVVRIVNEWNTRFELERRGLYLILMLDTVDYQWAVVSSGDDHRWVWVLGREQLLTEDLWRYIFDQLRDYFEVDIERIDYTRHTLPPEQPQLPTTDDYVVVIRQQ